MNPQNKAYIKQVEPIKDFDLAIKFLNTCTCCGKQFETEDPLQELCHDCLGDLSDFLVISEKN